MRGVSNRKPLKKAVNFAPAVGKRVKTDTHFVEQRQVETGQRRRFIELDVTPSFHPALGTTRDQNRQVRVVMHVGVSHAAAVKVKRMVELRAVPRRRRFQLAEELGKQRHVELIDLGHPRDLFRIVAVMGKRMMRIGDANLGIGSRAGFASELERDDHGYVVTEKGRTTITALLEARKADVAQVTKMAA